MCRAGIRQVATEEAEPPAGGERGGEEIENSHHHLTPAHYCAFLVLSSLFSSASAEFSGKKEKNIYTFLEYIFINSIFFPHCGIFISVMLNFFILF